MTGIYKPRQLPMLSRARAAWAEYATKLEAVLVGSYCLGKDQGV
jgi:hypothetical protein